MLPCGTTGSLRYSLPFCSFRIPGESTRGCGCSAGSFHGCSSGSRLPSSWTQRSSISSRMSPTARSRSFPTARETSLSWRRLHWVSSGSLIVTTRSIDRRQRGILTALATVVLLFAAMRNRGGFVAGGVALLIAFVFLRGERANMAGIMVGVAILLLTVGLFGNVRVELFDGREVSIDQFLDNAASVVDPSTGGQEAGVHDEVAARHLGARARRRVTRPPDHRVRPGPRPRKALQRVRRVGRTAAKPPQFTCRCPGTDGHRRRSSLGALMDHLACGDGLATEAAACARPIQ